MTLEPQATSDTERAVAACRTAHAGLVGRLGVVDDVVVHRPSRLPGWSIGHVLSHLARNADSFVRMLEAAGDGRTVAQYPGGTSQRDGEIETGAARSAAAIVNDVRTSAARLDDAFAAATPAAWAGCGRTRDGEPAPCALFPLRRLREVELHHVDLGLGYEPGCWPADFVELALPGVLAGLPGRIGDPRERAALLAWATCRSPDPGRPELAPY
ncbi:MAG TPA: maleylpyruvate isomerase N-terminal domain-containing protein [Acidimicrobiales bacterium]|nr:maleylpyruvate isomerase N-terminal domain-containing protein [Acidimicrobiales bacterium]